MNEIEAMEIEPTTINEVSNLFDDLATEMYYGFNLKLILMELDDSTIHILQNIVKSAKDRRDGSYAHQVAQAEIAYEGNSL